LAISSHPADWLAQPLAATIVTRAVGARGAEEGPTPPHVLGAIAAAPPWDPFIVADPGARELAFDRSDPGNGRGRVALTVFITIERRAADRMLPLRFFRVYEAGIGDASWKKFPSGSSNVASHISAPSPGW